MKLINYKSKRGIINLFADYILNKIDKKYKSIIQVTDFGHFFVVDGKTESTDVLDCSKIRDEFFSENEKLLKKLDIKQINIMDIIKYDIKEWKNEKLVFSFYNSDRPSYHEMLVGLKFTSDKYESSNFKNDFIYEINSDLNVEYIKTSFETLSLNSEFPHGYSLQTYRAIFYYLEYIVYNLKGSLFFKEINFIFEKKEKNNVFDVYVDDTLDDKLKSLILDLFDFNFEKFCLSLENYDYTNDLTNPFKNKPWLVKTVNEKDLYLI